MPQDIKIMKNKRMMTFKKKPYIFSVYFQKVSKYKYLVSELKTISVLNNRIVCRYKNAEITNVKLVEKIL